MSLNREQRFICEQQQDLYEYVQEIGADVFEFSDDFLNSRFCNCSIDKPYSVDQCADILNWLEFLEQEGVKPFTAESMQVPKKVAGWVGFTYRQIHFETGLPSKQLCAMIPIKKLVIAYPGLHTVDENMAAEIVIKDFIK